MPSAVTFAVGDSGIANNIYIPRYYDPRINQDLNALTGAYSLHKLSDLIKNGHVTHDHGSYIPKIYYGTGPYPYVRTSDIANLEIKASPKHGLAEHVFNEYSGEQDVRPGDILFVHEGTYLIGSVAMVTPEDGPITYQHHLAKFRVNETGVFTPYYFLAILQSAIVQRQIRARQFSADIIDSVVGRLEEVVIPIPRDRRRLSRISDDMQAAVESRARARRLLAAYLPEFDSILSGKSTGDLRDENEIVSKRTERSFLRYRRSQTSFTIKNCDIADNIILPKYYDPSIVRDAKGFGGECDIVTMKELRDKGVIEFFVGDEIGAINYGSGVIPFVRTSDFGSWELLSDSKHGVSEEVFDLWSGSQDAHAGDILMVRDGTYLVGTSVMLFPEDLPLLYCGGIYKIRCKAKELSPYLIFALLNIPFVQRQIRNKQFTRDVIDTIGNRLEEVFIPIPKSRKMRDEISNITKSILETRNGSKRHMEKIISSLP